MKFFRSLVLALVATPVVAFAQQDEERRAPPIEIPDFSNLDEYIYEPKSTLSASKRNSEPHQPGGSATSAAVGSITFMIASQRVVPMP